MSAALPLPSRGHRPTVLHNVTQQEIAAENEQGTEALLLAGVMSELREATARASEDPMHAGKLARGLWALARWRDAERRWKHAAHLCEIARASLALEAARTLGVCMECSATATDGYCDECREVEPPF